MSAISHSASRPVILAAVTLLAAGLLPAQSTGTIYGTVSDQTGAAVPRASVTVVHEQRATTRTAETSAQGEYSLPALPVGQYTVKVEAAGFKSYRRQGVELSPDAHVRADAKLEIGTLTESVTVTGEAPLVDSRSSSVGTLIDGRRVVELPINGRNVVSLTLLLPGITNLSAPQTFTGDRSGPTVSVSGSRANNNLFLLDGAQYNALYRNTGLNYPPPDALQEVKVLTNTFSAEYGRNSGAVFSAVTRSGTNRIHGAAWEFLRNQALNARNFFAGSAKPQLIQNQFGAAAGGPIRKDKLFVFLSYEGLRIRQGSLGTGAFPLTAAERNGDFSGARAIRDPLTGQNFANNQIPASRIDPVAKNLLAKTNLLPLPNRPDGQYVSTFPTPSNNRNFLARTDYNRRRHTIDARYNQNLADQLTYVGNMPEYATLKTTTPTHNVTAGDTFVIRPNLLNEARVSYSRFTPDKSMTNRFDLNDLGGKFPISSGAPPFITISGRMNLGASSFFSEQDLNQSWQMSDRVQITRGRHNMKAGFEVLRWNYYYVSTFQSNGVFNMTGSITGNAAADFLLGKPASLVVASPELRAGITRFGTYSFFQDDWKVSRRLTLNLGLRYEISATGMHPYGSLMSTFRAGEKSQKFAAAPAGMLFPGDPGVPDGTIPVDKNNFAPRIGLAWDPFGNGRTSVRAGYGVFYESLNVDAYDQSNNQPYRYQYTINTPPSLADPLLGYPPIPLSVNLTNPIFTGLQSVWYLDPTVRSPYVQQFNVNVQHEVVRNLMVQAGYFGRLGFKLPITLATNPAIYGPGATLSNIDQRRLYRGFADNNAVTTQANSSYHGLQVEVTKRYAHGFSLQGAYSFARAIDMYSSISIGANTPNIFDLRSTRGLADGQAQHIASISWIWDLPKLTISPAALRAVAGGWQFNGLFNARSGTPFDLQLGSDVALSGTGKQRPSVTGDPRLPGGRPKAAKLAAWFDRAVFVAPATGTYGNVARNALVGPGSATTNIGLFKSFRLPAREGMRLQFRSEFFNVLNRANFGNPLSSLSNGVRMGQITGAGEGRVVQFALKVLF